MVTAVLQFIYLAALKLTPIFALGCLWGVYRFYRKQFLTENFPTIPIKGVFMGLVEVCGKGHSSNPLVTPFSATPSIFYRWEIYEKWQKTNSKGAKTTGWESIARGSDVQIFTLQDETGEIRINPSHAKIEGAEIFRREITTEHPLYYECAPRSEVSGSLRIRRFVEHAVSVNSTVFIVGQAKERKDRVEPEIVARNDGGEFLISNRSEKEIINSWKRIRGLLSAGSILSAGIAYHHYFVHPNRSMGAIVERTANRLNGVETQEISLQLVLAGWVLLWGFSKLWAFYDALVDLRQRVHQAWANLDVQLKRRNDLIPNLMTIIQGLIDHEKETLEVVTLLRKQQATTPVWSPGPDPESCGPRLVALAERYPDLKTAPHYQQLMKELSETETRIALARNFFNEITTFYNTRVEQFPALIFARGLGFRSMPLLQSF